VIRNITERAVLVLSWTLTVMLCAVVLVFVGYLLINSLPSLGMELIFGAVPPLDALLGRARVFDGLFAALAGTLLLVAGSTALAVPTGVAAGIYLAEYASPSIKRLIGFFFDLLAGIVSGIMLAIGRCAEDTAVIMLTGVVATAGVPRSPLSSYEALPFYIYYISSQYTDQAELSRGYGACLILMTTCALLFMLAYSIQRGLTYRSLYRL
jgi:ABC-type phosphate transport system permease subunit